MSTDFKSNPADPRWFHWQVEDEIEYHLTVNPDDTNAQVVEAFNANYGKYCTLTEADVQATREKM